MAVATEEKQKALGFLTGDEIRERRTKMNMTLRELGAFLKIDYRNISKMENGRIVQSRGNDLIIRIKTQEFLDYNAPERKRTKKVFLHMIQNAGKGKLFLGQMLFYVDFWNFKKFGKSLTGIKYTSVQHAPCPLEYDVLLQEMIADGEITAIQGHKFKANKTPDMNEFAVGEMDIINEIVKLAKGDKGEKLYNFSKEEKGFLSTSLGETISYEKFAKDLKIEQLINEIAGNANEM